MPDTIRFLFGSGEWEPHFVIGLPVGYTVERKKGRKNGPYQLVGPQRILGTFKTEERALFAAERDWESRHPPEDQGVGGVTGDFSP